jgi:hypothetical protein
MKGKKFTTYGSKKPYIVIEEHKVFKDVWRCYPANKETPYKQNLIDCFSTDFINDCIKQELHDRVYLNQ